VFDRVERGKTLRTDPVALGIIGALSLGFVAAVLFAVIGFAVSAAVSSRERLTEFALLRALGLSTGQLSSWLSLENGLLVALSLAGGTGLGLLLAWLVLPLVSLTQAAGRVVPGVQVVVPWGTVALLELGMLLALVVVVGSLAWALRRVGLGSVLRLGEER
jgi:ABC-type antimicrobial peptide transport system permease subunit